MKLEIENLKMLIQGRNLNLYQMKLAMNEWHNLESYVNELEKLEKLEEINSICNSCTVFPFDERGDTPLCPHCKSNSKLQLNVSNNEVSVCKNATPCSLGYDCKKTQKQCDEYEVSKSNECNHPYVHVVREMDYEKCTKCGKILCEG
jgi:hypothetical protein